MTIMVAEVFDALRSAGADEDKARAAAVAVATQLHPGAADHAGPPADLRALPAPGAGEPGWDPRVDQVEQQLDARVGAIERGFTARLSQSERQGESRFERSEARYTKLDERVRRVEKRIDSENRGAAWLKWLVALMLLLQIGTFYLMWRILLTLPPGSGGLS